MSSRFMSIWFRHLLTDWYALQDATIQHIPFVLAVAEHGRMMISAANGIAEAQGIFPGMVVADARAVLPTLEVIEESLDRTAEILIELGHWCKRYTPEVAIDPPDGLILDISGCPHLWGGEAAYLKDLVLKLRSIGYDVRGAIADSIGAAWAIARYGKITPIIEPGKQKEALIGLPAAALRLDPVIAERLRKLGLYTIGSFINMPSSNLRRRFGQDLLIRIEQALGTVWEHLDAIRSEQPYQERLSSLEPIRTAGGIEIALRELLERLCLRLYKEGKGLRTAIFTCCRIDNEIQQIEIGTNKPSRNAAHIFKLFELKIATIAPGWGIEVFILEAPVIEDLTPSQEALWDSAGKDEQAIAELLDRIAGKVGQDKIHRYLPDEHHWPERSFKEAPDLREKPQIPWPTELPRPIMLLSKPEPIKVSVRLPDYPPMHFIYKNKVHQVKKADGPERIEREWWIDKGLQRDYYLVEDQEGARYWLFRSGHYDGHNPEWFLHGFFA